MICFDSLTYVTFSYILGNLSLHPSPPKSLSLGWSWGSDILLRRPIVLRPRGVLLLRGLIILRPLYILLRGSKDHLLWPRLLVGQPWALRDTSRRSSYTS